LQHSCVSGVSKAYGARVVFDGLDLLIRRGERWCVMGANGAGKSTLLKLVAGALAPDAGAVTLGASVKLGYFAQHSMELLEGEDSVWTTLEHAFPQASVGSLRALAARFGFPVTTSRSAVVCSPAAEGATGDGADALHPPNFLVPTSPQTPRSGDRRC
jgi:ATPase subunit of ABC transporter with duplicated ATPase domains